MSKAMLKTFNTQLRRTMKYGNIKNTDIAKAMDKKKQIVSNYFTGITTPAWADTIKLIYYLQERMGKNLDVNFLFGNSQSNDLLHTIQKLQDENSRIRKAYDDLVMNYVSLNDEFNKNTKKLIQKIKK